jgi:predicted transcriptional regulator
MSATGTCNNAMCSCDPCGCDDCRCGGARLGDLERRVMDIVWRSEGREVSVREVADALPEYAYTTVATVLDRLVHKEMLNRRIVGRTIRFATIGNKGAHTAVQMRMLLAEDGDPEAALEQFAEGLSDSEASILRRSLSRMARTAARFSA